MSRWQPYCRYSRFSWVLKPPMHGCCRAGELSAQELEQLMVIVGNPRTFKIPDWFLNRCAGAAYSRHAACQHPQAAWPAAVRRVEGA